VSEMNLMKGNINVANEMLDGLKTSAQLHKEGDVVKDLCESLRINEPKLQQQIPMIEDDEVISVCLLVLEDLQFTLQRFNDLKGGKQMQKFVPGESK
jgi:hypothetical protein